MNIHIVSLKQGKAISMYRFYGIGRLSSYPSPQLMNPKNKKDVSSLPCLTAGIMQRQ